MNKILEYLDKHFESDLVNRLIDEEDNVKAMNIRAEIKALRRFKAEIKAIISEEEE